MSCCDWRTPVIGEPGRPTDQRFSIGEVADRLGLAADTLRYYERRGVLPMPQKDSAGRRRYRDSDIHLLEVLLHLKETGMPLNQIAEFTRLVAADPDGVPERLALLRRHREQVVEHLAAWQESLSVIDGKIADYSARLERGRT